jgi:hypothetical protein
LSRGLGRIERRIVAQIEQCRRGGPDDLKVVQVHSWEIAHYEYATNYSLDWEPTHAQRVAVARAMRSFVRKFPQHGLIGGKGHKMLYLYDRDDPLSVRWAEYSVSSRKVVSASDARKSLERDAQERVP